MLIAIVSFLDDVDRIATQHYEPSDDDIVRARLRTMGVQEHRFLFERGAEAGQEWLMYDERHLLQNPDNHFQARRIPLNLADEAALRRAGNLRRRRADR